MMRTGVTRGISARFVEDCWRASYGGYGDIPHYARSTLRNRGNATHRKDDIGFRLVIPETGNSGF
jgi:formylglycine-generating enzyme required for sulfatase activity